jgi:hypothetical protein
VAVALSIAEMSHAVMMNLFQHPSLLAAPAAREKWTLKQVQGDEKKEDRLEAPR